ncbi:MAG: LysM peptidoglycan-binding domain-containing protein [Gammaproteobacteria bacterium]
MVFKLKDSTKKITFAILLTIGLMSHVFAIYQVKVGETPPPLPRTSSSNPFTKLFKTDNLWIALQQQFTLNHQAKRPEVQAQINWFMRHKKFIYLMANNAKPYLYYILQQVKARKLPAEIALLPMIESAYDPFAYSKAGAAGLWQMMPGTASGFGLRQNWWYDGRRDIVASTKAALGYLGYLENFFNGNWILAVAAYDTGEGAVLNAIHRNVARGRPTDFWDLPLSRETKAYIPKLLALSEILSHPKQYPLDLPSIKNQPYLAQIDIGTQIDLKTAARLSGLSLKALLQLNPGYNRWATEPSGKHTLLIPIENVSIFERNFSQLPKAKRVTWQRYRVKKGDTLLSIAHHYHTNVALIKQVNKLHSNMISINEMLFIPLSSDQLPTKVIKSAQKYLHGHDKKHPGPQKLVVTVKKGDTVNSIARKYHVKTNAIRFWNHMKKNDTLRIGQHVILWLKHLPPVVYTTTYHVKGGDSLIAIAHTYHTTVSKIKSDNHLKNDMLHIGQRLLIVPGHGYHVMRTNYYTVKSGDTLSGIATQFHVEEKSIIGWNKQLAKSKYLMVGERLVIYTRSA